MARAKVSLRRCLSFVTPSGSVWKKGETRIITKLGEIQYYRTQSEFVITELETSAPSAPPPPSETPAAYTSATLHRMTKEELQTLGAERFNLILEDSERKDDMVDKILEAQG